MTINLGDVVENGIWVTGDESPELRTRYDREVLESFDELCRSESVELGPITMVEKKPGDDRVPQVPDHIQGSEVRLLIFEATVIRKVLTTEQSSFVQELERSDLMKLRKITRDSYYKQFKRQLNNIECDEIIEALGPDSAVDAMRTIH